MQQQIELAAAKQQLAALLDTAIAGTEVIITENDQPLVKLLPLTQAPPLRPWNTAAGQIWMADDFNDSFEDYEDDIP